MKSPDLVTLSQLNRLRFRTQPKTLRTLRTWCETGLLPAVRIGHVWHVDLAVFDQRVSECVEWVDEVVGQ